MKKVLVVLVAVTFMLGVNSVAMGGDGATLYMSCAGCHGADGGRLAGANKILKGQNSTDIEGKIAGYVAGTYGGDKKAVMVNIAKKYSSEEIKLLADHIATFK